MDSAFLNTAWPVLRTYDSNHLRRIALPLGGIGTGTVSLGGRGDLRDFEIVNRPAKGFTPERCFFMLYAKPESAGPVTRVLEGPIPLDQYEGDRGAVAPNHGLPRFRHASFHAAYPFGQVSLADPSVPLRVRLEAFNPLIPGNAEDSGLPVAVLRFVLHNPGSVPVAAAIAGTLRNFIGMDGTAGHPDRNANEFRGGTSPGDPAGLFFRSDGVNPAAEQWGTMALVLLPGPDTEVTARPAWYELRWNRELRDLWEKFAADGRLDTPDTEPINGSPPPDNAPPCGSLAGREIVAPRQTVAFTFLLGWHFPNRRTWTPGPESDKTNTLEDPDRIGNLYTTVHADAWAATSAASEKLPELEADSQEFVRAFCASDMPAVIKEAALFNLADLRSQTCFRTPDGRLFGWEGCCNHVGCCYGSCTHVWNYEQAVAFLFGDLARTMREVEFEFATLENGHMNFRVPLPLERARKRGLAAADGQMGCLMKLYRDWQLSGDNEFLEHLWPNARKALEFCWVPDGWDADQDGVMEGCQHNTMDVEYYGPNPQMQGWYLVALRAAEEMARHIGDPEFAQRCQDLFNRGSRWMDEHLFNGEYYEQEIRPVGDPSEIAEGLRSGMGAADPTAPEFQLGNGCLVDQLVGQFAAHTCGLGYLLEPEHVRRTLRGIVRHNFRKTLEDHINHMRSFALGRESGLLMASYPHGERPKYPFPYFSEIMTGFEYAAAVGMLFEGQERAGLRCIKATRSRYDGRKRNPFDETECGHYYARSMASWAAVIAWTGFRYSGVDETIEFAPREGRWFWANGRAWGTCRIAGGKEGEFQVKLEPRHGEVELRRLTLRGVGHVSFTPARRVRTGELLAVNIAADPGA